jgi:glucose/arabinose dehydrogenase
MVVLGAGCGGSGGSTSNGLNLQRVGKFEEPVFVTQPRGGSRTLYVVERAGRIRTVAPDGRVAARPFLDLHQLVSTEGEAGLLSLAFAPDYERSGRIYVDYAGRDGHERIVGYRRRPGEASVDPGTASEILSIPHPNFVHWGGLLQFGPGDHLFVGTGDGGPDYPIPATSQDRGSLLGKILRIDPCTGKAPARRCDDGRPYSIPAGNPYAGRPGRDEIYALGLRNPWRFSIDSRTGDLWIGDVGDFTQEEIDRIRARDAAGANLGWPDLEGTAQTKSDVKAPGSIRPVLTYARTGKPNDPNCAVTGGYVVHDPGLPSLEGRYLYGDFCKGQIRSFEPGGAQAHGDRPIGLTVPRLVSFGEDASLHLYAISLDGPVYRLTQG